MEIEIVVYKGTGNYYTSGIAKCDKEIPLWEEEFKEFVANNLPALYSGGFVTVADTKDDCEGFHHALFRMDEITPYRTKVS